MNSLTMLVQVMVDLFFMIMAVVFWIQLRRPKREDPRLGAGLQELQSKISVLEDLGDRTEKQVQQLMTILENKLIDVQKKIDQADNMQGKISKSMEKSLEVVKIFQDKIPHEEIRERQNTIKFVKAALLANQGHTIQEISEQVDLPFGEIEFIAKVNKNELSFDENQLPEWIQSELKDTKFIFKDELQFLESPLQQPQKLKTNAGLTSADQQALFDLGEKFRQAQILISQRKVVEPQQKVFAAVESKEEMEEKQDNVSKVAKKEPEYPRKIAETVQRLMEQQKNDLRAHHTANLGQVIVTSQQANKSPRIILSESIKNSQSGSLVSSRPPTAKIAQESQIFVKGKQLGIQPVVFPRIEIDRK